MLAFTLGALLPLLTITLPPDSARLWATVLGVGVALALTGWLSARLGSSPVGRAVLRNVGGGMFAMAITHAIGQLLGTQVG